MHVHVYYTELWGELERSLRNLVAYPCEIYVTYVKGDAAFEEKARTFGHGIQLIKVENAGYDIAPFLHVLKQVNTEHYSYVAKLHTKRDMPAHAWLACSDVKRSKWRKYLLAPFATPDSLARCLRALEETPQLGMVAHHCVILQQNQDKKYVEANRLTAAFCEQYHISLRGAKFVAGSMFLCRAHPLGHLLKIVSQSHLTFAKTDSRHERTDLSHVLERVLGYIFTSEGLEIRDVFSTRTERCFSVLRALRYFIIHMNSPRRVRFLRFISLPLPWVKKRREGML